MKQGIAYAHSPEKRALDIAVASAMLVPAGLGLLTIKFALRHGTDSAIFRQARIGANEEEFEIFKLHTLRDEKPLFEWAEHLRKSRLDEAPQAVNILKGQMGACGHRPMPTTEHTVLMTPDVLPDGLRKDYAVMITHERPGWFSPYSLERYAADIQGTDLSTERIESEVANFYDATLLKDLQNLCKFGTIAVARLFEEENA